MANMVYRASVERAGKDCHIAVVPPIGMNKAADDAFNALINVKFIFAPSYPELCSKLQNELKEDYPDQVYYHIWDVKTFVNRDQLPGEQDLDAILLKSPEADPAAPAPAEAPLKMHNAKLVDPRKLQPAKDMVDKPEHYSRYGIETIDALKGTMSPDEFNGFLKGNALKYLTRAGAKDSLEQDLHKVCWYAMFLYLQNGGDIESLKKTCAYMEGRFTNG